MSAFYNENDAQKAAWLRELIKAHVIAPGEVDERSITDIRAEDLRGFTQCHFFAGIGVWSYALRLAGWPDDRPVWTGSCPCPSFSCAGKGKGFDDPRHLWPAWFGLIEQCRPATLFGEQADDAIGYGWLDLVQTDLEGAAYSVGKAVLGACSVGAPHIRQRLYFCAHTEAAEILARSGKVQTRTGKNGSDRFGNGSGDGAIVASPDTGRTGTRRNAGDVSGAAPERGSEGNLDWENFAGSHEPRSATGECEHSAEVRSEIRPQLHREHDGLLAADGCEFGDGADAPGLLAEQSTRTRPRSREAPGRRPCGEPARHGDIGDSSDSEIGGQPMRWLSPGIARHAAQSNSTRGFWRNCDWWYGRDGKYRPIESGLFPLAHGAANRVLKLRGYGDAIVPQVAAEFVSAYMEVAQ